MRLSSWKGSLYASFLIESSVPLSRVACWRFHHRASTINWLVKTAPSTIEKSLWSGFDDALRLEWHVCLYGKRLQRQVWSSGLRSVELHLHCVLYPGPTHHPVYTQYKILQSAFALTIKSETGVEIETSDNILGCLSPIVLDLVLGLHQELSHLDQSVVLLSSMHVAFPCRKRTFRPYV